MKLMFIEFFIVISFIFLLLIVFIIRKRLGRVLKLKIGNIFNNYESIY